MVMLAFTLVLYGTLNAVQVSAANSTKIENAYYTVISEEKGTAQYKKPEKKSCLWANIPETVKIGNVTYKVSSIADNAFKNCTKLREVYIGKNVTEIGKKAFYGCGKLVCIAICAYGLSKSTVGSSAFKKVNAQAMAVVPEGKLSAYKSVLKGCGLNGKKQKVKEEKSLTFGADNPLPKPEHAYFAIGDYSEYGTDYVEEGCRESSSYTQDEVIQFSSRIGMRSDIYGAWNTRKNIGESLICGPCSERFFSDAMLGLHVGMSECGGGNVIFDETERISTEHYFVPDTAPCKVVCSFMLPEGLSYKEGSVKVSNLEVGEINEDNYYITVSGKEVAVTIDDIKLPPFHFPFNEQEYLRNPAAYELEADRLAINIAIGTVMNEHTAADNVVTSSMTYSYKGAERTVNLGSSTIHAAKLKIKNTDMNGNSLDGASFTLYQKRGVYKEGSALGVLQWIKVAEGLKADEVIAGLGTGETSRENCYRIVQDSFPEGYEKTEEMRFKSLEFTVNIDTKGKTKITAEDIDGKALPAEDGIINITVINQKK